MANGTEFFFSYHCSIVAIQQCTFCSADRQPRWCLDYFDQKCTASGRTYFVNFLKKNLPSIAQHTDMAFTADSITSPKGIAALIGGGIATAVVLKRILTPNNEEKEIPVAPPGSKFVKLPKSNATLRYIDNEESSSSVTFVLIHGFAGVSETWELLTPHLKNHRVVALDLVGSGFSDKPLEGFDYSYRTQGKVVSEFISLLGLKKTVLVGHSSGTVVAASAALQTPEVVGVVFIANALFRLKSAMFSKAWLKPLFGWMVQKMMADRKSSLARMHRPDYVLTDSFVEKFAAPTRLPNFHEALLEGIMVEEAPYEDLVDELLSTPKPLPLLFVYGKDDTYKPTPEEQKEVIQQKLDAMDAKTKEQQCLVIGELEKCHHYAQHERPEALAKEILGYVEKNITL